MAATKYLSAALLLIFLLDTFWLVPQGVKILTKAHLLDGDKSGALTVRLKLVTSRVKTGEIWRPLTSMFLHAGIPHIAYNLICLITLGCLLEPVIGPWKLLGLFVGAGFVSALCMMALIQIEDGLGASTGIYGLFGVLLVLTVRFPNLLTAITPLHWVWFAVMVVLGFCMDSVTRLEHFTGMVGGILLALVAV